MPVAVAWTIASTHSHLHCYYYRNVQIYVCQKGWGANRNKIKWKMLRKIHKNYNHNKDNINININRKEKLRINILIHSNTIPTICERAIRIWFGLLHTHSHTGTFIYIYIECVFAWVSEWVSVIWRSACACVAMCEFYMVKYHWNTIGYPIALQVANFDRFSITYSTHTNLLSQSVFRFDILILHFRSHFMLLCAIFSILLVLFQSTVHNVTIWYLIRSMWCCYFYCYTDVVLCSFMLFSV